MCQFGPQVEKSPVWESPVSEETAAAGADDADEVCDELMVPWTTNSCTKSWMCLLSAAVGLVQGSSQEAI